MKWNNSIKPIPKKIIRGLDNESIKKYMQRLGITAINPEQFQAIKEKTMNNFANGRWGGYNKAGDIEFIPTSIIEQFYDYDRIKRGLRGSEIRNDQDLMKVMKEITENGFIDPMILDVNPYNGFVRLNEGNHRLAIAKMMGLDAVPVMTKRTRYLSKNIDDESVGTRGAYINMNHIKPNQTGDFPYNIKPSELFSSDYSAYEDPVTYRPNNE